jgi:hypothetical protein
VAEPRGAVSGAESLPPSPFSMVAQQRPSYMGKPPTAGRNTKGAASGSGGLPSAQDAPSRPGAFALQSKGSAQRPAEGAGPAHAASGTPDLETVADVAQGPKDIPAGELAAAASGGVGGLPAARLGSLGAAVPALINGAANTGRDAPEAAPLPSRPSLSVRGGGSGARRLAGDSPRFSNIVEGVPMPSESLLSNDSEGGGQASGARNRWKAREGEWPPPITRSGRRRLRFCMLVRAASPPALDLVLARTQMYREGIFRLRCCYTGGKGTCLRMGFLKNPCQNETVSCPGG